MDIELSGTTAEIDFGATGTDEILQNVRTILATLKYTVPLYRDFGVDGSFIDEPMVVQEMRITTKIVEAVAKYEPRAEIKVKGFKADMSGKLIPEVEVSIDD